MTASSPPASTPVSARSTSTAGSPAGERHGARRVTDDRRARSSEQPRSRGRTKGHAMRLVVVGGSGLIGDKVMTALDEAGHHAVAASPAFGIDAYTGEGLDEAMAGADVVIDVSNAP